jgi:hypothetical protein
MQLENKSTKAYLPGVNEKMLNMENLLKSIAIEVLISGV